MEFRCRVEHSILKTASTVREGLGADRSSCNSATKRLISDANLTIRGVLFDDAIVLRLIDTIRDDTKMSKARR